MWRLTDKVHNSASQSCLSQYVSWNHNLLIRKSLKVQFSLVISLAAREFPGPIYLLFSPACHKLLPMQQYLFNCLCSHDLELVTVVISCFTSLPKTRRKTPKVISQQWWLAHAFNIIWYLKYARPNTPTGDLASCLLAPGSHRCL